ncbi:MAG: heavy metal-responsive transcriptional regulator [Nitrospira sp.]|nr:heavy metal-responsive transcriptional regulator [Nitrospira sp.]
MAMERTIGRLAKVVGVNVQTMRYYERLNLLGPTGRKPSGYRLYGPNEERRLQFIKNAQSLGFTLHEIAELLNLRVSSTARCGDVQRRAQAKLKQVVAKLRDLHALAQALHRLIQSCRARQPTAHCPILTSLEEGDRIANWATGDRGSNIVEGPNYE